MNIPLICVVGPTASGKSELAVILAKKLCGEIISCDSRQIYKGMDIGTGKVDGRWTAIHPERSEGSIPQKGKGQRLQVKGQMFVYKHIPHYCIDYVSPKKQYSASLFKEDAEKAIQDITARGRLPILCGGTGHWVDAVAMGQILPEVPPNPKLRKKLESLTTVQLFDRLKKLDPVRASEIDQHNPRRLIRALEIVITTGKPVPQLSKVNSSASGGSNVLYLGITWPQDKLYARIKKRLIERLDQGMVKEIKQLHDHGISWKRLENFGLEYKYVSLHLQRKLSYDEMFDQLLLAICHYAKRQMTWFKRNKNIHWVGSKIEAQKLALRFLKEC